MASGRTGVERRAIAEFVTGKAFSEPLATTPSPEAMCGPSESDFVAALDGPRWAGWGANTANTRFQETEMAGLTAADVPRLEVKWAFGFPGELSMDAQPTVTGGRVFLGTQSGAVYSLSAATGCVHWMFQAAVAVRAAISIGRVETQSGSRVAAFIGDRSANVYAVDAATGELLWTTTVDDFALARVTGSPTFHDGRLYVGVASGEESAGASADYECCTFRGSLLALDAVTGAQIWKTYTIETGEADGEKPSGNTIVGSIRRADLEQPSHRRAAKRRLRHHRQQLQRPGHRQQRRLHGLRHGLGPRALGPIRRRPTTTGTRPAACRTRLIAPISRLPTSTLPHRPFS